MRFRCIMKKLLWNYQPAKGSKWTYRRNNETISFSMWRYGQRYRRGGGRERSLYVSFRLDRLSNATSTLLLWPCHAGDSLWYQTNKQMRVCWQITVAGCSCTLHLLFIKSNRRNCKMHVSTTRFLCRLLSFFSFFLSSKVSLFHDFDSMDLAIFRVCDHFSFD